MVRFVTYSLINQHKRSGVALNMETDMRTLILFTLAFALIAGAFAAKMLTASPKSEAAARPHINIRDVTLKAHPEIAQPSDAF